MRVYKGTTELTNISRIYRGEELIWEKPLLPSFDIINRLDGTILNENYNYYFGEFVLYKYEFTNGIMPTSVTVNGQTSTSMVELEIFRNAQLYVSVRVYVDGTVAIYQPSAGDPFFAGQGSLFCNVQFTYDDMTAEDTFTIRGYLDPCFAKGTLVLTPSGYKKIEEFNVGDAVISYDIETKRMFETTVEDFALRNGVSDLYKITFSNETSVTVTSTHGIYTLEGWKCVKPTKNSTAQSELRIGDKLPTFENEIISVTDIEALNVPQPVYHLSLVNGNTLLVTDNEKHTPVISEHYYEQTEFIIMFYF